MQLCLSTGNVEGAEEHLHELRETGSKFIESDMSHYIDLLSFKALFRRQRYNDLKKLLVDKLKRLLELGYCKKTYFEFLLLLLDVYVELKDFSQASSLVDNNLQATVQYNLELYYYTLKVYQMRVYTEIGNLDKAQRIHSEMKIGVAKARSKVQALFYYTSSLLFVKVCKSAKSRGDQTLGSCYEQLHCSLKMSAEKALLILDVELLKKLAFLSAVLNDNLEQPILAESWAKKHLQIDSVGLFVQKNYKLLEKDGLSTASDVTFFKQVYKILKQIIAK